MTKSLSGFGVVTTAVASAAAAREMAHALVDARIAACVQILPITSIYRWEGKVEEASEHLLLCKIAEPDFAAAAEAIRARHTYDLPEILYTPITNGDRSYLDWIDQSRQR